MYILTLAQSLGSQDYYNKSLMTILGLAGVSHSAKMSKHRQTKWIIVCSWKILTWVHRESSEGLKVIASKRVTTLLYFFTQFFLTFCFFQLESCFPWQAMFETISAHFGHCGPKSGGTLKNILNKLDSQLSYYCSLMKTNPRKIKAHQNS